MPLDPSVLLRPTRAPQWPDPLEEYKGFLSLRQMMDLGRQRQALMLEHEQKQKWELEDRNRAASLRDFLSKKPDATFPEIAAIDFPAAVKLDTERRLREKAGSEQAMAALETQQTKDQRLANLYAGIRLLPPDQQQDALDSAFGGMPMPLPPTEAEAQSQYAIGYGGKGQQAMANAAAQEKRAQGVETRAVEAAKTKAIEDDLKVTQEQGKVAGSTLGFVADQDSLTKWYSELPAFWRAKIGPPPPYNEATMQRLGRMFTTQEQQQTATGAEAGRAEMARHHRALEEGKSTQQTSALVSTVMANPQLWDSLTPTAKTLIAPELGRQGFTGFGTKLSEGAINKMAESRSAIASVRDLRDVLKANEKYLGPISGAQAMWPWSEAKKAQANIDLVRQRVGKALEGGVLRKEDEEKYKKILATLMDTPSLAIYKIDQLEQSLNRDIEIYIDEQRKAGHRVGTSAPAGATPAGDIPNPIVGAPTGVPKVGGTFNGKKVTKVTKVQ